MKKVYVYAAAFLLAACGSQTNQPAAVVSEEVATVATQPEAKPSLSFNNADFYDADGKFNQDKAKEAVLTLMKYYGYPILEDTKSKIWVSDYGTGRFTEVGLACIGMVNNPDDGYMLQDLFLLPGQMLPEHWHLKPEKYPAKMEGWYVRYGKSYIVGEGEDNQSQFAEVKVPAIHNKGEVTVHHVVPAEAGDFVPLTRVYSHHWQLAGPEGAILTEVANGHSDKDVRHLDPVANKTFLGL